MVHFQFNFHSIYQLRARGSEIINVARYSVLRPTRGPLLVVENHRFRRWKMMHKHISSKCIERAFEIGGNLVSHNITVKMKEEDE